MERHRIRIHSIDMRPPHTIEQMNREKRTKQNTCGLNESANQTYCFNATWNHITVHENWRFRDKIILSGSCSVKFEQNIFHMDWDFLSKVPEPTEPKMSTAIISESVAINGLVCVFELKGARMKHIHTSTVINEN